MGRCAARTCIIVAADRVVHLAHRLCLGVLAFTEFFLLSFVVHISEGLSHRHELVLHDFLEKLGSDSDCSVHAGMACR